MLKHLSAQELSDLLHHGLLRVVKEAVERDRLYTKGEISRQDAAYDLRLDVEEFFGQSASRIATALTLKNPSL